MFAPLRLLRTSCSLVHRHIHQGSNGSSKGILKVALIGRPNVGKSTLFNRLTRTRAAIVTPIPGTTRDRRVGKANIAGMDFEVIDTGGLERDGSLNEQIRHQSALAAKEAHLILFVVDGKQGCLTSEDLHFAQWLRAFNLSSTVRVLVNKTEGATLNPTVQSVMSEAAELGFGTPIPISAEHSEGMSDIIDLAVQAAADHNVALETKETSTNHAEENEEGISEDTQTHDPRIHLAIMGVPNVGKSSLLNAILGDDRVITGPTPGVTRDAVEVSWEFQGRKFKLVDTPGLDRLRSQHKALESTMQDQVIRSAMQALKYANVVLLVVDPSLGGFRETELKIIQRIAAEGRACVIAANKADLTEISAKDYEKGVREHVAAGIYDFGRIPVVACSATERSGVRQILPAVCKVYDQWNKRIPTNILNKWLQDSLMTSPAPAQGKTTVKIKYATQLKARPPSFAMVANVASLPDAYLKFIRHRLQHDFHFDGVPIRIRINKKQGKPKAAPSSKPSSKPYRS